MRGINFFYTLKAWRPGSYGFRVKIIVILTQIIKTFIYICRINNMKTHTNTYNMKARSTYNKSEIMTRAWVIYRKHNHKKSWSDSLKESWAIAKGRVEYDFNKLYSEYYNYVLNYTRSYISNNPEMVEEIAQDTFIKVADNLHTFDSTRAKISTWIISIAKNTRIDHLRRVKNEAISHISDYTDDNGNEYMQVTDTSSADDLVENDELREKIENAFSSLKPQYKEVGLMYFVEGYKYEEIAEIMDMNINSVKSNIHRARTLLQAKLDNVRA